MFKTEETIVRRNLMECENYTPYCGSYNCSTTPRTQFDGNQFKCNCCGWVSEFPVEFITRYKQKWNK
jgi:hypothetical protein